MLEVSKITTDLLGLEKELFPAFAYRNLSVLLMQTVQLYVVLEGLEIRHQPCRLVRR